MNDVVSQIRHLRAGTGPDPGPIALATVVQTWGSAPRKVGAKMAITRDGRMAGSVSGGCVEGAVAEAALDVLATGRARLLTFGVADETAWQVGLACGGVIQIFVETLDDLLFPIMDQMLAAEQACAVASVIAGPDTLLGRKLMLTDSGEAHGQIDDEIDATLVNMLAHAIQRGASERVRLDSPALELFVDVLLPAPTLLMIGAVHIATALTSLAKILGFRTIVVDPREAFASDERFPHADRLLCQWPQDALSEVVLNQSTAVALLTHDPKIDDPALEIVLAYPVFYVGALGSRTTHAQRVERLSSRGIGEELIQRIHAPIGLDIHAQTPDEIALSIMAEIVAVRRAHGRE